ncbi:BAR-domain-containing protein [Gymnopus androsaceus JB14]|uniref:BAR-domain-containing protein n=1 Tax=Gymnopus androsaceus JB14 TaxID=1447944 RepID=A0A6A4IEQ6_9AGAR|nr:BAR-domain-containing protein [Gymnopus androsaceus JB14]
MASKQLGKLRQWAGEVISSREKTVVSEEFNELAQDIELRRGGVERLFLASKGYHHWLSKKKDNLALDDPEKLLPLDILGIILLTHGEEFGDDSEFGSCLTNLGKAHCKVATLQEAYAVTFQDTFLSSIEKFGDEIREYDQVKKKLESRRLSYDAAISKVEKLRNSKKDKEKERKEAEEELEKAQARYEETTEDLRAQMYSIQENEIDQTRELTAFLDLELNFVEQYLAVLKDVKSGWNVSSATRSISIRKPGTISRSTSIKSKSPKIPPATPTRSSSRSRGAVNTTLDSTDDEGEETSHSRSRRSSMHGADAPAGTPISRPSSRTSRNRTYSNSAPSDAADKHSRKISIAGWGLGSFSGRSKRPRDKEQFSTLDDGTEGSPHERGSLDDIDWNPTSSSILSTSLGKSSSLGKKPLSNARGTKSAQASPQITPRILKPQSMQSKKVMRAMYDFDGAADELSFRVGDEITVVSEVLDGWWMGELNGRQGLFPTPYTEVVPAKPPLPTRPDLSKGRNPTNGSKGLGPSSRDSMSSSNDDDYGANELDEEDILATNPLSPSDSPFFGGPASPMAAHHANADTESILSNLMSEGGDDENDGLVKSKQELHASISRSLLSSFTPSFTPPSLSHRSSDISSSSNSSGVVGSGGNKKVPPPPPPRRITATPTATPPIPSRRPSNVRSQSYGTGSQYISTPSSSVSSHGYDTSPFESATELQQDQGCSNFKQNPFKPKGMCSNCLTYH